MCGITGAIGNNALSRVRAMLPKLAHRGPDGEGVWSSSDRIALGHRRLAINDLSKAGKQPMLSVDGKLAIVVNGEIYNYPELRHELERSGAVFQSDSDSEVVLHAWRLWGRDCFIRFNGMFALGLYDQNEQQLVLARDRLGIKPLYYSTTDSVLVFASEVKALLEGLMGSNTDLDPIGLNQYLFYQNCFGERTLRQGVKLLQPGHYLVAKPGSLPQVRAYWSLDFQRIDRGLDFATAVSKYRDTLTASVSRHLMSDVPVASYLSAGFDSATVANRAAAIGDPPACFTGSFKDGGWYDEASIAKQMADRNGSRHVTVNITSDDLPRVMDQLIYALDEPKMGMGAFAQYCVAERVARTHKVILTGLGGDELFSGYPVFKLAHLIQEMRHSVAHTLELIASLRVSEIPHLAYFALSALKSEPYRQFLPVLNSKNSLQAGLKPKWAESIRDLSVHDELQSMDGMCHDRMQTLYSHYLQAYLNGLLVVEDKLSMEHSLESRTPMLDNHMLDLSLSLPQSIKLHHGQLKAVIKEGGRLWLPRNLYSQPKRGFPTPLRRWLRGPLEGWFKKKITGNESGLRILFTDKWLRFTYDQYQSSYRQHVRPLDEIQSHRMWQLLSLESWLRHSSIN